MHRPLQNSALPIILFAIVCMGMAAQATIAQDTLWIRSNVPGARAILDGKPLEATTNATGQLVLIEAGLNGIREITLSKDGFNSATRSFEVSEGTSTVDIALSPTDPLAAASTEVNPIWKPLLVGLAGLMLLGLLGYIVLSMRNRKRDIRTRYGSSYGNYGDIESAEPSVRPEPSFDLPREPSKQEFKPNLIPLNRPIADRSDPAIQGDGTSSISLVDVDRPNPVEPIRFEKPEPVETFAPSGPFGGYSVEREFSRGSSSILSLAENPANGQKVALKVMREELASEPKLVEAFLSEHEVLTSIHRGASSQRIVRSHSSGRKSGSPDGAPFVVLDYIQGVTLKDFILQQTQITPANAVSIGIQIAKALEEVHSAGCVHGDLSPSNIILTIPPPDAHVTLIDFGVPKAMYTERAIMDGSWVGKIAYQAPELFDAGSKPSTSSDIYGAGVLLHLLLSGEHAFADQNPLIVALNHQDRDVPQLPRDLPTRLVDLVHQMLSKRSSDRPSSVAQVTRGLETIAASL